MKDNFLGYYIKINGCEFRNPQVSKFKYSPALILVANTGTTGSGRLVIKSLPHTRKLIEVGFPPMLPEQFRIYWKAIRGDLSGPTMNLSVKVFDESIGDYVTDTFYHNDITYETIIADGRRMLKINDFQFIGH